MKKSYYYCLRYSKRIENHLRDLKIKYEIVGDGKTVQRLISFTVSEEKLDKIRHLIGFVNNPIVTNVYSEDELNDAEFLTIRPIMNIVNISNTDEAFYYRCPRETILGNIKYNHREQISDFCIAKICKSTNSFFYSSSTGFSE